MALNLPDDAKVFTLYLGSWPGHKTLKMTERCTHLHRSCFLSAGLSQSRGSYVVSSASQRRARSPGRKQYSPPRVTTN